MGLDNFLFYFIVTFTSMAGMFIKNKMKKRINMFAFLNVSMPFQPRVEGGSKVRSLFSSLLQ
jgi:hypothetical protein